MKNTTRALIGATLAGVVLAILPTTSTPAEAGTNRRCETTSKGKVCAKMHKPGKTSKLGKESRKLNGWRHLPITAGTKGTYQGYARRNLANGSNVITVRSKVKPKVWHTYTIRKTTRCKPFDAVAAQSSESIVYPQYAPKCEGHVWVLRGVPDLPEDAYGWNCYTDGNGSCGTASEPDADGCVSFSTDHYTMCPDGRVFLKSGLAHRAELIRR